MKFAEAKTILANIEVSGYYCDLQKENAIRRYCEGKETIPSKYLKPVLVYLLCRLEEARGSRVNELGD